MAYAKKTGGNKRLGSIVLAGTLAFGMAHHLRAEDTNVVVAAVSSEKAQTVESAYREAFQYLTAKPGEKVDGTPAVLIFKGLPERFPNSIEAMLVAANIDSWATPTDYNKAIEQYDKIIEQDPKNVAAYVGKGTALFKSVEIDILRSNQEGRRYDSREITEATQAFDTALKLDPNNFAANYNMGAMFRLLERSKKAIKYYQRAIDIGLKTSYNDRQIPNITDEGKIMFVMAPAAECCISGAMEYTIVNGFSKVVDGRRVIVISDEQYHISNENDAMAFCYCDMGLCYSQDDLKNYGKAIKYLSKAIELNPDVPKIYHYRAGVYTADGQLSKAAEDTSNEEAATQRISDLADKIPKSQTSVSVQQWIDKAMKYADVGDNDNVLKAIDEALKIQPENPKALALKGTVLLPLGRFAEANKLFDEALKTEPSNVNILINKAYALTKLDRNEDALKVLDEVVATHPENKMAWNNRGQVLRNLGRFEEALKCFSIADSLAK